MPVRLGRTLSLALLIVASASTLVSAAEISPHRALYSMSLQSAKTNSGVVGASGAMTYEWGETCDGWTIVQRFRLNMQYSEQDPIELTSSLVTWESKDGMRYRFNERRMRNGEVDEDIRGDATLAPDGKGGTARFIKPEPSEVQLPVGTLFPTAHTILLIDHGLSGDNFIVRNVFDGASVDNASQVTAVMAEKEGEKATASTGIDSPLLKRPSWRTRLAFFPADSKADHPDYELGMRLLDNGVSSEMSLDYGDYAIRAKLDKIEALPKPNC